MLGGIFGGTSIFEDDKGRDPFKLASLEEESDD
jgi:hypothetical protein